jgi:hypothetical protein
MVKLLSLAAACIGACAFAGTAGAQTVVPTLTGETLLSGVFAGGSGSTVVTSESCNPAGTSSFSYESTGIAAGPYPGTYVERGTVTIGPQIFPGSPDTGIVTDWTASYTITSATGNVTGTKTLTPPLPGSIGTDAGSCTSGPVLQRSAATGLANQPLAYTATITTATGEQFSDHGLSNASVNSFPTFPLFDNFFEDYTSLQATVTPLCNENDPGNQDQGLNDQGCANP